MESFRARSTRIWLKSAIIDSDFVKILWSSYTQKKNMIFISFRVVELSPKYWVKRTEDFRLILKIIEISVLVIIIIIMRDLYCAAKCRSKLRGAGCKSEKRMTSILTLEACYRGMLQRHYCQMLMQSYLVFIKIKWNRLSIWTIWPFFVLGRKILKLGGSSTKTQTTNLVFLLGTKTLQNLNKIRVALSSHICM